jgi:hypothetical protein
LQQQQCSQQQKQQQPESKHQKWSDSHQGNVVGDDVISKIFNLERKTADKIGCVDLEENTELTLVNLGKQYIQQLQQEQQQQQLADQQHYTELEEKLEAHQQWHQHQLGQQQKQSSQQQQQQQQEDDLTSQEEIKPEVNNYHPLVSITLPSPNPSILLNHHLKENLNPGLVMTSMTLKTPRITSVTNSWTQTENEVTYQELAGMSMGISPRSLTSRTTSQTTLPARHFKENLDPGLVPIPPTPLMETQTDSPTSHLNHDVKKIPYQGLIETPPVIARIPLTAPTTELNSRKIFKRTKKVAKLLGVEKSRITDGSKRGWKKRKKTKRSSEKGRIKKKKKTLAIKAQITFRMKNNPGQIWVFQVKHTGRKRETSTSVSMEEILLGRVTHHTRVNKQTGAAHNLTQNSRPFSKNDSVRCLHNRTTLGRGRPPEAFCVQKETGKGGSRSQG